MFFIGVMGISQKEKVVEEIENLPCLTCKETPEGKLVKVYSYFHVFFIPLIKWNIKYLALCSDCKQGFEVSEEKGKAIEKGRDSLSYWDLKAILPLQKSCMACDAILDAKHKFCPHCGKEV